MANRFPLIVNAVDAKIYELASGDNLDLTGSSIYNNGATLTLPTASGTLATLAGTETLTNKTIYNPTFSANGGDEGGEVKFALPVTNTTLSTSVTVDVYQNKLRIFETGGTVRGASLDISALSAAVGSDIVLNNIAQTLTNKTYSSGALTGTFTGDHTYSGLVTLSATSALTIPVGTTAQRPTATTGQIRFNSSLTSFEGYNGTAWSSLGGVKSVDGFTYIQAETSSGAGNGDLDFFAENAGGTAAQQVGQWNRTNLKDYTGTLVGTQTTQNVFNTTATTVNAFGAATALTIGATTGTATIRNATTAISGAATVGSTLGVTGATTLSSTLAVTGLITSTAGISGGPATHTTGSFSSTLGVTGATTLSSTLAVTGGTTLSAALTYGGVTLSNSVTGTGSMVLSASPTFTGTVNFAAISTTGNASVGGALTVTGDLTVNGTTTTVNSTTVTVDDKNIELGSVASPTNTTADGGGITLKGTTDKTFNWVNATSAWTSSEHLALAAGKNILLNGSTSGTITLAPTATAGTTTITLPATTGTVVTTGDTGTVTNTMLAGSIANAKLANSTISGIALGSNLATLTMGVSGTGLSGSTTYNGSGAATFTVTSNATNANTASAIVARDASGNFSAGTITAALSGNATTATTATNLASGSAGTIPYQTGAGATAMLAAGTSGYFLKANGAAAPSWVELSLTDLPDAWVKKSVRVATTANITLSGTQTIDGVAVVAGDRVLVKDQTTTSQNGIYIVAAGAWSRATDANTISKLAGALVNVDSGTVSGGLRYDTDLKATDTLDTTAVNFYKAYDVNDAATANTASKLVLRDASGNFSAGTITAALSGNATTATTLQTARTINGVSFNGSANITVTASTTNALTIGTGLSGTSFNGGSAVTIAIDSTVVTLTGTQTLTNKTLTSPTLTTPNIGAATGTSLSVSGQLTSTVATGTAPLVVTSTTKVANLNVEMVDGYHADTANTASTIAVRDASSKITASGQVATGGMFEHSATISANYAVASGNNAISAGPVSVASGITVTIPSGSVWTIV